ncbi:MAG: HAD-IA family hydrolase, partial [Candidatus Eremiobacterota bacterium]
FTTLFCDVGGVLLTNGWDRAARERAAERFRLDLAQLEDRHHLTFDTYEEGKLSLDDYLERTVFYQPRDFTLDDFKRFMFDQSRPFPEMLDLLRRLRQTYRLRVVVVSNEGRELTLHRVKTFRLNELVDCFVSSCFVHFRKPDTDIFRMALDLAQAAPEEVLYIDDRALFIEVAATLGIRGIRHADADSTRLALAEAGLPT